MNIIQKLQSGILTDFNSSTSISTSTAGSLQKLHPLSIGNNENSEYIYRSVGTTLFVERKVPFVKRSISIEEAGVCNSTSFVLVSKEATVFAAAAETQPEPGRSPIRKPSDSREVDLITLD